MSDSTRRRELLAVVRDAPGASSPEARAIMRRNRRTGTRAELALRSELHRLGLRFRVDHPVRAGGGRPIRPDVVFSRGGVAVFVDGCFWHGCPEHGRRPKVNSRYWSAKVELNQDRDARQRALLEGDGWAVMRIWEHEQAVDAAVEVAELVRRRRGLA